MQCMVELVFVLVLSFVFSFVFVFMFVCGHLLVRVCGGRLLQNNQLQGSIPSGIGALKVLQEL